MLSEECNRRIYYMYSEQYQECCDRLPSNTNRSTLVHSLIKSFGLFEKMSLISPPLGTAKDFSNLPFF
ncbi:histone deacetylase hos1 [Entomophthora muscae]|uniref:Histone deacetylase hos1 n=1 Tax=Entomophthora muscae TaxID=34485 RepID=A0ACC2UHW1_9FUNG|nr:histone deacetylase hos1 [Entomophthora muscae]